MKLTARLTSDKGERGAQERVRSATSERQAASAATSFMNGALRSGGGSPLSASEIV